jgi:hypothetical protein
MPVCLSAWNTLVLAGRIFKKIQINLLSRNLSRKIKNSLKSDKNIGTLHEDHVHFFIIYRAIILRMKTISEQLVAKIKTHISRSINIFYSRNFYVCDKMLKNNL